MHIHPHKSRTVLEHHQLLRLSAGFGRVVLGIPICFLIFSNYMNLPVPSVPAFACGLIMIFWGIGTLYTAKPVTATWDRKINTAFALAVLQLYFIPFLYWWLEVPTVVFYAMNVLAMAMTITWLLIVLNHLAAEFAGYCQDDYFKVESLLCAWLTMGLLVTLFAGITGYVIIHYVQEGGQSLPRLRLYPWLMAVLIMPFTLTLASMFKCWKKCGKLLEM
jgi:hypothetical protein